MKMTRKVKALSFIMAVVMAVTTMLPVSVAFAGDGVEGYYDLQIFYDDGDKKGTIVPSEMDGAEGSDSKLDKFKVHIVEGEEMQFTYKLIDSVFPDNGYIKWYSDAPALADVDQTGKVKGFDSSKGAVIHLWIDNEVKTIPVVGGTVAKGIEKVLFNEYVNVDKLDNDAIIAIVEKAFGSDSIIADNIESYKGELIDSLRYYLDNVNSDIHCQLFDGDGTKVAEDIIHIVVDRNDEWYANFLPNGTHITNKSQIPTTQAVKATVQLYGITTPQRLNFGTVYSVKASSIFSQGKVVATCTDGGLVTFKNKGNATIMASPDSEDVINALLKFINYFYTLENTGTINTDKAAEILIKYIGIDINRAVLAGILDAAFAIYKIAGDAADPVQLTATAVEIIANLTLQFVYNDTIDFTVVDAQPIQDFKINGAKSVKEGVQTQLSIDEVVPTTGDKTDIVWRSSDPSIACVDEKTGVITALDAGGSLGALSSQTCTIYATSTTNNVERSFELTVTGKTGKYISKVDINGKDIVGIESSENFTYSIYPKRVAESENLYITWGMVGEEDEDGNPTYIWADKENAATDPHNVAQIDDRGRFKPLTGGRCTIALQAKTGYQLSDGSFYEISSYIATKEIETGIPVEKIKIGVTESIGGVSGSSSIGRNETVTINGEEFTYTTVKIGVGNMYNTHGARVAATITPANATDQNIKWVCDNKDFKVEPSSNTQTVEIKRVANKEYTDTFNLYAVSDDGYVKSNVITVCVTRNYATSNKIDQSQIDMINGKEAEATHSLTFGGTWESRAYACYGANWYSSDESVFSVRGKGNDNYDAVLTANDVGTAKLYCVSADGAFVDSVDVTVRPNKQTLEELVNVCDRTIVLRTKFNQDYYKKYMRKLDQAYIVLYEQEMASQNVVDTTASELLAAFTKVGGFVGITGISMLGPNKSELFRDYVTVEVGSVSNYKNYSYDFDYQVKPKGAMYSKAVWTSSNPNVLVDENGVCHPKNNDPCAAAITCTVTDYAGNEVSVTKHIAFARTKATGVELNTDRITGAKIGTQQTLTAKVLPKNVLGNSTASVGDVSWYSTNENVVTVDANGTLTFVYGGDAVIVCTTADGGYQTQCAVNVTTNYDALSLLVRQYNDLELKEENYYPETWEPYITAKSDAEKMITKKGYSQEAVDAKYKELETAYKNLKKFVDIQKVELYLDGEPTAEFYQYDLRLLKEGISYKNAVLDLNVRLYPNNATYQKAEWKSSTTDISVSSDGVCSPTVNKSCYGSITCTVTDSFGKEFSDDVWVSFSYNPVTAVRISQDNITGAIGTTYKLDATIEPTGSSLLHIAAADIKDYFWETDDETVATVDNTGLVTFTGAGSTVVRCVSYDGGVNAECKVSSEGDRTELKAALEKYESVDYTKYEYTYGIAFKKAYDEAVDVLGDKSKTQDDIDIATSNLNVAGEALEGHPYKSVESIRVTYETQKRSLSNSATSVSSGTVGSNDALQVNLSSGYSNYNDYNDVILTAFNNPSGSMFRAVKWEVVQNNNMVVVSNSLAKLTIHPSDNARSANASALVRAIYTDHYGKDTTRDIWVTMSDTVCTGLSVTESALYMKGSDDPRQLHWSTLGASGHDNAVLFSSSNEDVATVSSGGKVSVVDAGECTITVKTRDGGYTSNIKVYISTDFSKLANKVQECEKLINDVRDTDQFTQESIDALAKEVDNAKTIVNDGAATQRQVNEAYDSLMRAYNGLTGYVPATGISIQLNDDQTVVTEVNKGFIRYETNVLNNTYVQLRYAVTPNDGMFETISWTSSNPDITVDENGKVVNTKLTPAAAKITATIRTIFGDEYNASVYVSFVRVAVKAVSTDKTLLYGGPEEKKAINPVFTTDSTIDRLEASVKDCLFESENEQVATVDAAGMVTFHTQGKTRIKITAVDGGVVGYQNVQTTWDTSTLQEAIAIANAKVENDGYMNYEYSYGMKLKADLDAALKVYNNPDASQSEIDAACFTLNETLTTIEEHKFVKPVLTMTVGDTVVTNGTTFESVDGKLVVDYSIVGNMYKPAKSQIATSNETNCSAVVGSKDIVITKTETGIAKITLEAKIVDSYDRETTYIYNIFVTDKIVNIDSISITYNGEVVDKVNITGTGIGHRNFEPFTLGYVVNTVSAAAPTKVEWSSSNAQYVTVDETGKVELTTVGKATQQNNANITCTVTNPDGTTVSTKIPVTISMR